MSTEVQGIPSTINGAKVLLDPAKPDVGEARFAFLRTNSEVYERLVGRLHDKERHGDPEQMLGMVKQAALWATLSHTGRFSDGALENVALRIGSQLKIPAAGEVELNLLGTAQGVQRRILHVFTQVMGIGGHTRMLHHWAQQDRDSQHSVALLDQRGAVIPSWLSESVHRSGGTLAVQRPEWSIGRKAMHLRQLANRCADLVVLHHHSWDVVPTVAFAVEDCPPVAVLNHADHLFWLGSSVADLVINLRTPASAHSVERRAAFANTVLPIPLVDHPPSSHGAARKALGIPEDRVMLLSVGRAEKYRPCGIYNFVAAATRILEAAPGAHLYLVGVSNADLAPFLRSGVHARLHLVGVIEDPSLYRAAADVYLESFPFGSQTALLEAALCGLPVVPAYNPLFPLLVANDDSVQDLIPNPQSEQEYVARVVDLVRSPSCRWKLGSALRERLVATHTGGGWRKNLTELYRQTDSLVHRPRPIPTSRCEFTDADAGLSIWHAMSRNSEVPSDAGQASGIACWNAASVARQMGAYGMARALAWKALLRMRGNVKCWRLFLLTCLGRYPAIVKCALRKRGRQ